MMSQNIITTVAEVPPGFQDPPSPAASPHGSPTDKSSCGSCQERLPSMGDPRKLPCSHIFCFPCLQSEFDKIGAVNCHTCGKVFDSLELDKITKVQKMKSAADEGTKKLGAKKLVAKKPVTKKPEVDSGPLSCDVCKKDPTVAVSYCVDCGKKMCQRHVEFHDGYQKDFSSKKHKRISIEVYKASPNRFEVCDRPGHTTMQLKQACKNCYKLFCDRCDVRANCDVIGARHHDVRDLEDLSTDVKEQLTKKMSSVSGKITDIIKLQKSTSGELCDIEEKVNQMTEEVDRILEEQVAEITLKANQLKSEIKVHLQQSKSQVDMFSSSLMAKKDLLDELWTSTQNLLTQSREAEMIRQYKSKRELLDKAVEIELGFCHLSRKMLSNTGENRKFELEIQDSSPSGLKFQSREKNSTVHCSSTCWTDDGFFLCGRDCLLEVRHRDNLDILQSLKASNANGVALHKQGYLALHWSNGTNYIILYSAELAFVKLIGEFSRTTDKYSHLASSDKHITAVDPDSKQVRVFSPNGETMYSMKLVGMMRPWGIHLLPDGCALVSDFVAGSVKKYKLKAGQSEPIWVCRDMESPVGITTDFAGLIYVASFTGKKIYVLSHEGMIVKVLTHKKLQTIKEVFDIDLVDDQIVLACGEEGIASFQMTFDAIVI